MQVLGAMQTPCLLLWMVKSNTKVKEMYYVYNNTFLDELEERIIDINSTAVIKGTKVALLHMAKRGGGSIVNLASVAGLFSGP